MEMVKEDLAEALQIVKEMDREVSRLQSELQESLIEQRKLEKVMETTREALEAAEGKTDNLVSNLATELETALSMVAERDMALGGMESRIAELERELSAKDEELKKLEASAPRINGTTNGKSSKLKARIAELEAALQHQSVAFNDSVERTEELQEEVNFLQNEVKRLMQEGKEMILSSLGAAAAHGGHDAGVLTKVNGLEDEVHSTVQQLESTELEEFSELLQQLESAASQDERLAEVVNFTKKVEEENRRLRRTLSERNQVLNQSKSFIQQQLEHSTAVFDDIESTNQTNNNNLVESHAG